MRKVIVGIAMALVLTAATMVPAFAADTTGMEIWASSTEASDDAEYTLSFTVPTQINDAGTIVITFPQVMT